MRRSVRSCRRSRRSRGHARAGSSARSGSPDRRSDRPPPNRQGGPVPTPADAGFRSPNKGSGLRSETVSGLSGVLRRGPQRVGIPAPARRYSHLEEGAQAAEAAQRPIAAAANLLRQLSFFSQDQELRDHRRKPQMKSCLPCCQPSPTRAARKITSSPGRARTTAAISGTRRCPRWHEWFRGSTDQRRADMKIPVASVQGALDIRIILITNSPTHDQPA